MKKNSIKFFYSRFIEFGKNDAIIFRNKSYNYNELIQRIDYWRNELIELKKGEIIGLEADFSPDSIAILFVLIEKGMIIVPFDINHHEKNKQKYEIAQVDILIQLYDEENINIVRLFYEGGENPLYGKIHSEGVPGLVLFTSGSSGKPKGAVHNLPRLLSKFNKRRNALKTINFLMFDHWGGLNTLFHILSNGGTVVILESRNPDYVCEIIEKHKVELLPTSPTFLNMLVMSRAFERWSLKSLKVISYGAEPMPKALLGRLNNIFPDVLLQQTYGLIELGVMRSKSEDNGSLWVKIGGEGYQIRIVDNLLQIKSDSAMLGYLNAPSPFTEDGWFMTGDSVEVKGEYLRILGRKSEIINVGGEKVYPQEVENVIYEIEEVDDVLVYPEDNAITGKIVCAKIKYSGSDTRVEAVKKIKTYCRTKLETYKIPVKIQLVDKTFESSRFKKTRLSEN